MSLSAIIITKPDGNAAPIENCLNADGYEIIGSIPSDKVESILPHHAPGLILFRADGNLRRDAQVCTRIRDLFGGPLLVLVETISPVYELTLLENGADAVMAEPFSSELLRAHLSALGRRPVTADFNDGDPVIEIGPMILNRDSRTVRIDGRLVAVTTNEFDLLWFLAGRPGQSVSRDELYRRLLNFEYDGQNRCIDLRISRLRKKLAGAAKDGFRIKSVRSDGYVLVTE
jgi:DNA-binding response OmpR family regulator